MHGRPLIAIHPDIPLWGPEQQQLVIRGPLHLGEVVFELLPPLPGALNGAHDDGAVQVDDADLLSVVAPLDVNDFGLFSVVDHFLIPLPLV